MGTGQLDRKQAINSYTLPVIKYQQGRYNKMAHEEVNTTDIKLRKPLTMYGGFHPKSSIQWLYTEF